MEKKQPHYFVDFNDAGNIAGFYCEGIHDEIPETAVPITVEEWRTYSAAPNRYKRDGETIREKTPEEIEAERSQLPPPKPTFEQRLKAIEDLNLDILLGGV